jgi:NitT/TauT family transport system substrate-binding protein
VVRVSLTSTSLRSRWRRVAAALALAATTAATAACVGAASSSPSAAPQPALGSHAGAAPTTSPAAGAAPVTIHLIYPAPTGTFTPIFVALDQGFFTQQGLSVTLGVANGEAEVAALTSGEAQILELGATEVAAYDASGGDLVMVATSSNYPIFSLYAKPSIATPAALAGKTIGITKVGDSTDTAARLFLQHFGVQNRATIIANGTQPAILAALKGGAEDAGILAAPFTVAAASLGFRELVNGLKLGVPMNMNGVVVSRSYLAAHRDVVIRFLKAFQAGWSFAGDPAHRAATIQAIASHLKVSSQRATETYDAYHTIWSGNPVPTVGLAGVQNVLRYSSNPKVRDSKPASLIDNSLITSLAKG